MALSSAVDAFVLDSRDGYLGKTQAKWLKSKLEGSMATWKIVFVGFPVGIRINNKQVTVLGADDVAVSSSSAGGGLGLAGGGGPSVGFAAPNESDKKNVVVKLPSVQEVGEVDEAGRPKTSIQHIIASIQKKDDGIVESSAQHTMSSSISSAGGDLAGQSSSLMESSESKDTVSLPSMSSQSSSDENSETGDRLRESLAPNQRLIKVESGILIVSGGLDAPYVAALDPSQWNRTYCLEVCAGSPVQLPNTTQPSSSPRQPKTPPSTEVPSPTQRSGPATPMFSRPGSPSPVVPGSSPPPPATPAVELLEPESVYSRVPKMDVQFMFGEEQLFGPTGLNSGGPGIASCCLLNFDPEDDTIVLKVVGTKPTEDGTTSGGEGVMAAAEEEKAAEADEPMPESAPKTKRSSYGVLFDAVLYTHSS